ncbi:MAG TPA: T9SS type A sorting domain-containing protein [Chitinophagales bacterium]|nr:T9SS type A sorting domain-containing protein [Chitinophagales bacterium]
MKTIFTLLFACFALSGFSVTTLAVGPGQTYTNITTAYAAIPGNFSGAYVIELRAGYSSLNETFPLVLNDKAASSAVNTITIRPAVSGLVIASANTAGTVQFNACRYVTIDGSVNGAHDTTNLTIINTTTTSAAVVVKPNSMHNTLTYLNLSGGGGNLNGVVYFNFGTAGVSSDNTISYCNIGGIGNASTAYGIYSDNTLANCFRTQIMNNNFSKCNTGVSLWNAQNSVVRGNSFYTNSPISMRAIRLSDKCDGSIVFGNYFGGTGPRCVGSPAQFTNTGDFFFGQTNTSPVSLDSNVIRNLEVSGTTVSQTFISCLGPCLIGTQYGNLIGDTASNGSIKIFITGTSSFSNIRLINVYGYSGTSPFCRVENNLIGGIYIKGTGIVSIAGGTSTSIFKNNFIGSTVLPDNIHFNAGGDTLMVNVADTWRIVEGNTFSGIKTDSAKLTLHGIDNGGYALNNTFKKITINSIIQGSPKVNYLLKADTAFSNRIAGVYLVNENYIYGLYSTRVARNNTIDSLLSIFTINNVSSYHKVVGIYNVAGTNVSNNLVTNVIGVDSMQQSEVLGIWCYSGDNMHVDSNVVRGVYNLNFNRGQCSGLFANADTLEMSQNNIYDLRGGSLCEGIQAAGTPLSCHHNVVKQLKLTGISSTLIGIECIPSQPARDHCTNNVISDLLFTRHAPSGSTSAMVIGIKYLAKNNGYDSIAYNFIDNVRPYTNNFPDASVFGIFTEGSSYGCIAHNKLTHIYADSVGSPSFLTGIGGSASATNFKYIYNNQIQIGINVNGNAGTGRASRYGIYYGNFTPQIYYNTIYVAGNVSGAHENSYVLYSRSGTGAYYNNIFLNATNNSGGTGLNYVVRLQSAANQQLDYNIYRIAGNNSYVARIDTASFSTLSLFKAAIPGQNLAAMDTDALLINVAGDSVTVNMGPLDNSPAIGAGVVYQLPTTIDYYGTTRSGVTPTIGAIEKPGVQEPFIDSIGNVLCTGATSGSIKFTIPNNLSWDSCVVVNGSNVVVATFAGVSGTHTISQLPAGDYTFKFSNTTGEHYNTTVSITGVILSPASPQVSPQTICAGTATTITATGAGNYAWYDSFSGGNLLSSSATLNTGVLTSSTNYYVQTSANGCPSVRSLAAITAVTLTAPVLTPTPTRACQGQSITLSTGAAGTIKWYSQAVGGAVIYTGSSYTVSPTTTTIYYAEETQGQCTGARASVTVQIDSVPPAPLLSGSNTGVCQGSRDTLAIVDRGYVYNWYLTAVGGTVAGTGVTFTTPIINSTMSFYVQAQTAWCSSNRTQIQVFPVTTAAPVIIPSPVDICPGESAVISVNTSAGTVRWFDSPTATNPLSVGSTYTTAPVNSNTAFYADIAGNNGCLSARTAVQINLHPQTQPVITVNGAVLTSSIASGNQWYLNGTIIPGATAANYTAPTTGDYTVEVTNSYGCSATSTVTQVIVNDVEALQQAFITIYPNPCVDLLRVATDAKGPFDVVVMSMDGRLIHRELTMQQSFDLDISGLVSGAYILSVQGKDVFARKSFIKL